MFAFRVLFRTVGELVSAEQYFIRFPSDVRAFNILYLSFVIESF